MTFPSYVLGVMLIVIGTFNFISWLRDVDEEDIVYEYYESSSLEEETTKVTVVPVSYRGKRIK